MANGIHWTQSHLAPTLLNMWCSAKFIAWRATTDQATLPDCKRHRVAGHLHVCANHNILTLPDYVSKIYTIQRSTAWVPLCVHIVLKWCNTRVIVNTAGGISVSYLSFHQWSFIDFILNKLTHTNFERTRPFCLLITWLQTCSLQRWLFSHNVNALIWSTMYQHFCTILVSIKLVYRLSLSAFIEILIERSKKQLSN